MMCYYIRKLTLPQLLPWASGCEWTLNGCPHVFGLGLSAAHFSHRMCSTANNPKQMLHRSLKVQDESSDASVDVNMSYLTSYLFS